MQKHTIRSFRKLLRRFERLTEQQLKADSGCQGVSMAQCHAILEIEELGRATTVELARRLGLDKSTLSRTVDGLVNLGMVKRRSHPSDRRFTLLSLSPKGRRVADRINQANDLYYHGVFAHISPDRHSQVIECFGALVAALQAQRDGLTAILRSARDSH